MAATAGIAAAVAILAPRDPTLASLFADSRKQGKRRADTVASPLPPAAETRMVASFHT
jgi:hypothetical protein